MNAGKFDSFETIQSVFDEIRRLNNRLRWLGDHVHADLGLTAVKRSLLLSLEREGPRTVPELARERLVSRQIIQTQINELIAAGLVEPIENPRNRRSHRIALTKQGGETLGRMAERERGILGRAGSPLPAERMAELAADLHQIREHLEGLEG